ncbi:MAG: T9SS type A sorting domain-containing protein [Bacteroidota bacterium]
MRYILHLAIILSFLQSSGKAQSTFSHAIDFSGYARLLDVEMWDDDYLIRTEWGHSRPVRFQEGLMYVYSDLFQEWESTFNTFSERNSSTDLRFTRLGDSISVLLNMCAFGCGGHEEVSLQSFNKWGDVIAEKFIDDVSHQNTNDLFSRGDSLLVVMSTSSYEFAADTKIAVNIYDKNLDSLSSFRVGAADTTHRYLAGNILDNGHFLIVYSKRGIGAPNGEIKIIELTTEGDEVWAKNLKETYGFNYAYSEVLILPNGGVALLEGQRSLSFACAGSCPPYGSVQGRLWVYSDFSSPPERFDLRFLPYGMTQEKDGEIIVYGTTYSPHAKQKGVLFKPNGWTDGDQIHLLKISLDGDSRTPLYSRIHGMTIAENEDLVGVGEIGFGNDELSESKGWLFRLHPNGCFLADCSDLLPIENELVHTQEADLNAKIDLFPNPFSHILNLKTLKPTSDPITARLLNALGEIIFTAQLREQTTILTDNLPAGIYFVEFTQGSKRTLKKVIKQ